MIDTCPFCNLDSNRIVAETEHMLTIRDGFPVSLGHTLIIPKRHVASFFDVTPEERNQLFDAIDHAKQELDKEISPDGYNIGINSGEAAGQTVMHLHIHLIPRFNGDCTDPKGGIRWIFPDKAKYWDD